MFELWGPSKLCSEGLHEWCFNRSPDETHCGCECHRRRSPRPMVAGDIDYAVPQKGPACTCRHDTSNGSGHANECPIEIAACGISAVPQKGNDHG